MAAAMKASRVLRSGGLALRVAQGRCAPRPAPPPCAALWGAPTPGRAPSAGASWARLSVRGPSLPVRHFPSPPCASAGGVTHLWDAWRCAAPSRAHALTLRAAPLPARLHRLGAADSRRRRRWRQRATACGRWRRRRRRRWRRRRLLGGVHGVVGQASTVVLWRSVLLALLCLSLATVSDSAVLAATRSRSRRSRPAPSTCWATSSARRVRYAAAAANLHQATRPLPLLMCA